MYGLDTTQPPTLLEFARLWQEASDSQVGAKWLLADLYVLSEDNPQYEDVLSTILDERKTSISSLKKYRATVRNFPYARRKQWKPMNIEIFYTVNSLPEHEQDELLNKVERDDSMTREDLRAMVREKKDPAAAVKVVTEFDARILIDEETGERYIDATDIPHDVQVVLIKFERIVSEQVQEAA